MTTIRRFEYSDNERISDQVTDQTNNFLWIAYEQNDDGNCILEKVSPFDPTQVYYSLERAVDKIKKLFVSGTSIYCAFWDTDLIGQKISTTNPLTTINSIEKPIGITENPVDVLVDGSNLYFLMPGEDTGENAKVVIFDTDGNFDQTIDLTRSGEEVVFARSFTVDEDGDIWIVTYTDPATIVRVYQESGGDWNWAITEIV